RNNFLGAVYPVGRIFGLAFVDLTTGDFLTTEVEGETALLTELRRLRPAEIIFPSEAAGVREVLRGERRGERGEDPARTPNPSPNRIGRGEPAQGTVGAFGWILNGYDDWVFAPETAVFTVREHFKVASLDGYGLKERTAAIGAAGGVLHYLTQHLRREGAN